MARDQAELWAAYRATDYVAWVGAAELHLRVGRHCERLDQLLNATGTATWVFVTAWNPASSASLPEDNLQRNRQLRAELEASGARWFAGEGRPDASGWQPEASFLALGVERDAAITLGARYGQNAVLWGCRGSAAELLDCT